LSKNDLDIRRLARLAALEVTGEDVEELQQRLDKIKRFIDKLLEAPVEGLEPLFHPHDMEGVTRPDEPSSRGLSWEEVSLNAAKTEKGFVVGPRTVEE
jgi:aspartyl-tRNA(Asn)/glutamyl-tRNA(Gln) amidotransferase subunit C